MLSGCVQGYRGAGQFGSGAGAGPQHACSLWLHVVLNMLRNVHFCFLQHCSSSKAAPAGLQHMLVVLTQQEVSDAMGSSQRALCQTVIMGL